MLFWQPELGGKSFATKYEPTYKPEANLNYDVSPSNNGLVPDFKDTPYLHPLNNGKTIRIEMTGARGTDFTQANNVMKNIHSSYSGKPDNYTWHHMDDYFYDVATGKSYCTMQLVETTVHGAQGMRHSGSVAQMEKFLGIKYK